MAIYPGGQNICGAAIGVLCLESYFPKPPGHIKNPSSLPFAVLYETVRGATVKKLLNEPSAEFIAPFIDAAQRLEAEGVRAITGSCGFLALYQRELSAAVSIPVFASSLIQVPLAYHLGGALGPVGVLTASGDKLSRQHFEAVGAGEIPVAVQGMEEYREFTEVIVEARRNAMDLHKVENEVLAAARELQRRQPDIRSLVLECTDMPPYAHRLQAELGLPVFDLTTLASMVFSVVARSPYQGLMPA